MAEVTRRHAVDVAWSRGTWRHVGGVPRWGVRWTLWNVGVPRSEDTWRHAGYVARSRGNPLGVCRGQGSRGGTLGVWRGQGSRGGKLGVWLGQGSSGDSLGVCWGQGSRGGSLGVWLGNVSNWVSNSMIITWVYGKYETAIERSAPFKIAHTHTHTSWLYSLTD